MIFSRISRQRAPRLRLLGVAAALVAVAAVAGAASSALAVGDYGADTCLNGFIWRGVTDADHVCVTPSVHAQALQDTALASQRKNPMGGPYGLDTCLQGFVWREAVTADHACVTPAVRQQTLTDNIKAPTRRDQIRLAIGTWIPNTVQCDGDVCSKTSDDTARYRVWADRLNVGWSYVALFRSSDRRELWHKWVWVEGNPTAPGGLLTSQTDALRCPGSPNAYFRVKDISSGRWSGRQPVTTGCATL